ncbi:conserved hypothetical protein [Ricinus communis]|uniref:Uncharacterized protein n=1 Tax=Ricinus communis TaxID=3988 RepID=B9TBJ0_RICCO|nr:conserved hypothetical protein [Ricinus communis]
MCEADDLAAQHAITAHQANFHSIADMQLRELGFLEIAFEMKTVFIDDGEHRFARDREIALMHIQIGDVAIGRRTHRGTLEIQFRQMLRDFGFTHARLGGGRQRLRRFAVLARNHGGIERRTALGFIAFQREIALRRSERGVRLCDRQFVTSGVDREQHVAFMHMLVVVHGHRAHEPCHIRRHCRHIGAHAAVARPRARHVVQPQCATDQHGGCKNRERQRDAQ